MELLTFSCCFFFFFGEDCRCGMRAISSFRRHEIPCRFSIQPTGSYCGVRRLAARMLPPLPVTLSITRRSFHCTFHEPITPELITVEVIPTAEDERSSRRTEESHFVHEAECFVPQQRRQPSPPSSTASTSSAHSSSLYTDVSSIDLFCKGKVTNYLRRMGHTASLFEHTGESGVDGTHLYRCRVKLTLPPPHRGMFVAEGLGENEKDAENLAAMHAERIMDTLGVQLFRLPSMQQKHAEAARRQGRYAPMPDDAVRPEGTAVPPPFRMVTAAAAAATATTSSVAPNERERSVESSYLHHGIGRQGIAEAELVSADDATPPSEGGSEARNSDIRTPDAIPAAQPNAPPHPYAAECHFPWRVTHCSEATHNKSVNVFDPTENGMWQMCNVLSTRMSPSPDALLFPAVFEKEAYHRLAKEYFLFGHGEDIKRFIHISQVAVAGYASRMFVAEIKLLDGITAIARGKAQDKECATHLAAMHAELLIDALGKRLFPKNNSRQALHAAAVRDFGRWATDPVSGDVGVPLSVQSAPLPLPLKQQAGGDELWLDPHANRRNRTLGERVIIAHNDLYQETNDLIEVNPSQDLLDEARRIVREWHVTVAGNAELRNCFVVTKMGDFYRANTLLPVPRRFGIRGGCAVGRSVEQAIDLASLHALDVLCSLGVPIMKDCELEKLVLDRRRANGQVTHDVMQSLAPAASNDSASPEPYGRYLVKYLPGYIIEGSAVRDVPHIADLLYAWQLKIDIRNLGGSDFVPLVNFTDEQIIAEGNDIKANLTLYFNRVAKRGADPSVFISGQAMKASVYNVAFLSMPFPPQNEMPIHERPNDRRVVAVGLSLKKKDAERMCYFHADMILKAFGIDVRKEREILAKMRKEGKGAAKSAVETAESGGTRVIVHELPKPLMHPVFKSHHETARGMTPPRKRLSPNPY